MCSTRGPDGGLIPFRQKIGRFGLPLANRPTRVGIVANGSSPHGMAALPANPTPTISPAEMQILVSRAGLMLNPGQVADLVLAWRQVAGLIAALPNDRPLADDLAFSFRLPPHSNELIRFRRRWKEFSSKQKACSTQRLLTGSVY